jgi:hypothetical protein
MAETRSKESVAGVTEQTARQDHYRSPFNSLINIFLLGLS